MFCKSRTETLTNGFVFVFRSGNGFKLSKNQFAVVSRPKHACRRGRRGRIVRETDGFKLLQVNACSTLRNGGNILSPIDVQRLVDGLNPIDAFYAGLDKATQESIDAQIDRLSGRANTKYIIASRINDTFSTFRTLPRDDEVFYPPIVQADINAPS